MGWKKKIRKARKLHRPDLKDWEADGLYETFPEFVKSLSKLHRYGSSYYDHPRQQSHPSGQFSCFLLNHAAKKMTKQQQQQQQQEDEYNSYNYYYAEEKKDCDNNNNIHPHIPTVFLEHDPCNVPAVLDARTLTPEQFWREYEAKEIPCLIQGIPAGYDGGEIAPEWPAIHKWNLQRLLQQPNHNNNNNNNNNNENEDEDDSNSNDDSQNDGNYYNNNDSAAFVDEDVLLLRNRKFKCGEDDDGNSIKIRLKHFLKYLQYNRDDSPLYIFDSSFERDKRAKTLLDDYTVPTYFRNDLFRLVSEQRRPPYRWVLIGPERSGSCVHIDPLATNAWNTLLQGRKRWVLFPPCVPKHIVKGRGLVRDEEDDEAIHYFMFILPRIKVKARSLRHHPDYEHFACFEFTQNPGETVFVPNGWWHSVLNLTDTVAVTQNYVSERNFDAAWMKTRTGRKRMAWKWLCQLDTQYPHLAERARNMNERDQFKMKYDPAEIEKREAKDRRRKMQRVV